MQMETRRILALTILAIISATDCANKQECPVNYARFSTQHSFCLQRNLKCNIMRGGVDKNDIKAILKVHNELRSKVAYGKEGNLPTASNMLQMEWDEELAVIAQRWANQCDFNHDCDDCRIVENFKVGQNVAIQLLSCSSEDCLRADWSSRIRSFYNEVKDFNRNYISPFKDSELYGHFTQVVWAESWKVGCGYVAYKEANIIKRLYVCNYGPAGNYPGASMYKQGMPGSDCPANTCSGCKIKPPTYNGLCKVRNPSLGPIYKKTEDPIFDCNWKKKNSQCPVGLRGSGKWVLRSSVGGSYASVQLKPGEKSTLQLQTIIEPKTSRFCVKVVHRKGPVDASKKDLSQLSLAYQIQQQRASIPINMNTRRGFSTFSMNLNWNMKTQIMLDLYVPPNGSEHIFDIKEIVALEGACSY